MRLAAFRALSPEDGAGGGSATPAAEAAGESSPDAIDISALADAAYDGATRTEDGDDTTDVPDEGTDAKAKDDAVADAAKTVDDGVHPDEEGDTPVPPEVLEKYPVVGQLLGLDAGLSNPETAPDVLRAFAEGVAKHHGQDLATMLGLSPAPARDESGRFAPVKAQDAPDDAPLAAPKDWRAVGFASQAEYDAAPDFEKAGFASQGEYVLAKRFDALQAKVTPALKAQEMAAKTAMEANRAAIYEGLVAKATPNAIALVKAETGWTPTAEQVMAAAKEYPQIAAKSLSKAVQAAHVKEIVASATTKAKGERAKPPEMPEGGQQPGRAALSDEDRTNPQKLADYAYASLP